MDPTLVERLYSSASEAYAEAGIDTAKAIELLGGISLSIHCWQGDDVTGFESDTASLSGSGLQVTGGYPGKARNVRELREDLRKALSLIPGRHRVNLHAMYAEFEGRHADRNELEPEHFRGWVEWARKDDVKLDFNPTCFAHPKAASGYTLASLDNNVRKFWVDHVKACRKIAASIGREQKSPCINNIWIPDGSKDVTVDRWEHRAALKKSLDEIFEMEYSAQQVKDALESKLFGLGSESFVAGSHEFYLAYAMAHGRMICLDMGHFHPTESIADKLSSILLFSDELLLHLSRGVRWDSDHVVILTDELTAVTEELVRGHLLGRVHLALDYFDASFNRIGAWVLGARAVLQSLLRAFLQPAAELCELEHRGDDLAKMAHLEKLKGLPWGAVWDRYCLWNSVPPGDEWMKDVREYEHRILSLR